MLSFTGAALMDLWDHLVLLELHEGSEGVSQNIKKTKMKITYHLFRVLLLRWNVTLIIVTVFLYFAP